MRKNTAFQVSPFDQHRSMEDKFFHLSLIASFLFHVFLFICLFLSNVRYGKKNPKVIEVIYQTEIKEVQKTKHKLQNILSVREKKLKTDPEILSKKDTLSSSVLEDIANPSVKPKVHIKPLSRIQKMERRRHISVPMLQSEKITNPKYLNYHDRIRNKIRDRAYFYVDDPRFEVGEVYLTFVISMDGTLKQVKIIPEKTSANDYLKGVGIRSIKESAPFPPFPKDLKYPELSFNVIISFKIDD